MATESQPAAPPGGRLVTVLRGPPADNLSEGEPVPRLIHLNGPCGIGKSTLAQLYVEAHPGTLNLDIDQIAYLIGGWREDFPRTLGQAARLAATMASTHLAGGNDVVLPQLIVRSHEIAPFEAAARANRDEFYEIVLMAGKQLSLDRVAIRTADRAHALDTVVERHGGQALRAQLYDDLVAFLRTRPGAMVINTDDGAPAQTSASVITTLITRPPPH